MGKKKKTGIRRLINAYFYSLAGFKSAWKNEEAFRQEILASIIVIPTGIWLGTTNTQRALLVGFFLIIPLVELINCAIESVVDRLGPEHHVLSGRAKDSGSAAVLLSICINIIVWGCVFCERFIS